jgi:hypothetical protein
LVGRGTTFRSPLTRFTDDVGADLNLDASTGPGIAISRDGSRIVYLANPEIFVRPFTPGAPASGVKWQISNGGGVWPMWSKNERELFYNKSGERRMYSVTYSVSGDSFVASPPKPWSEKPTDLMGPPWLMPDNTRFIGVFPPAEDGLRQTHITFLLNFGDEPRRRLTTAK